MGDKVIKFLKSIKDFFTGLFNLASFSQWKEQVDTTFTNVATQMSEISKDLKNNTTAMTTLSGQITTLGEEITKIKDGLQIELFGSLQTLHTRLVEQKFATIEQKLEAKLYYDQIHNLGKDGWSQKYYDEIIAMPESRAEYWEWVKQGKI